MHKNFPTDQQNMLNTLLDYLDGMLYYCMLEQPWVMLYVSSGCHALTGYLPSDFLENVKVDFQRLICPEDLEMVSSAIDQAVRLNQKYQIEYRIICADGTVKWVSERGSARYDDQGQILGLEGFVVDIDARKLTEQALHSTEQKYRTMFEQSALGMFRTTEHGRYIAANNALAKLYRYDSPAHLMASLDNVAEQLYVNKARRAEFVEQVRRDGCVLGFESEVYTRDGNSIWVVENAHVVYSEDGELLYFEGTVEDISQRKLLEQKIHRQAITDSLTGLLNRHAFEERLARMVAEADASQSKLAVAFIDIDHFKLINDTLGHQAGDRLLKQIATRLISNVRATDAVFRFGGDEFVILYSGLGSADEIEQMMSAVMGCISQSMVIDTYTFKLTCSIGVSLYPDHGLNSDDLLSCADSALYSVKHGGKSQFQLFTPQLSQQLIARNQIEYGLAHALQKNEFILYYQPKIDMQSKEIYALEALIRWQHPQWGVVSPDEFIAVAEETGHMFSIGLWVLQTACKQINMIQRQFGLRIPIAVNISPVQFMRGDVVDTVRSVLLAESVPPYLLTLEVTENAHFKDEVRFIETLNQLKQLGVRIAIDDFGIGYSNMAYLKHYPIDELKIDKAFVGDLELSLTNRNILQALIHLGKSLHKSVTAEGVENSVQHLFLTQNGCDIGQGFYYSKPLSVDALYQALEAQLLGDAVFWSAPHKERMHTTPTLKLF